MIQGIGKQRATIEPKPLMRVRITFTTKPVFKAEQVRNIIREFPYADADLLIKLVNRAGIGIPTANIKRYVTENVKRVRG